MAKWREDSTGLFEPEDGTGRVAIAVSWDVNNLQHPVPDGWARDLLYAAQEAYDSALQTHIVNGHECVIVYLPDPYMRSADRQGDPDAT